MPMVNRMTPAQPQPIAISRVESQALRQSFCRIHSTMKMAASATASPPNGVQKMPAITPASRATIIAIQLAPCWRAPAPIMMLSTTLPPIINRVMKAKMIPLPQVNPVTSP